MPKLPGTQWMIPVFTVNSEYRWSIQLDVLLIEGIPYRRLIGINNQKLPPELIPFREPKIRSCGRDDLYPFPSAATAASRVP